MSRGFRWDEARRHVIELLVQVELNGNFDL
jgi:hypothetical protein